MASASALERMPLAHLYRKAAKLMEEYDGFSYGCCDALIDACPANGVGATAECQCKEARTGFHGTYRPEAPQDCAYYFGDFTDENREARVIALCFAAAMVEAGDV